MVFSVSSNLSDELEYLQKRAIMMIFPFDLICVNSWISHDVTAAMLVSPNSEMVSMLVCRSNPPGIESYYYANVFF